MRIVEAREENTPFSCSCLATSFPALRAGTRGSSAVAAVGQMPSQTPFLIIFQIILWRKAPQAAAHVQAEQIRTQGPQLSHTVGEGSSRDRADTVSLGPKQDWGLVWVDTGQAQPPCCHPGAISSQGNRGPTAELQPPTLPWEMEGK